MAMVEKQEMRSHSPPPQAPDLSVFVPVGKISLITAYSVFSQVTCRGESDFWIKWLPVLIGIVRVTSLFIVAASALGLQLQQKTNKITYKQKKQNNKNKETHRKIHRWSTECHSVDHLCIFPVCFFVFVFWLYMLLCLFFAIDPASC